MRAGCSRPRSCRRPTRRWVVIRWANADCKIWHNDTNAPIGYGWHPAAFAGTWGGAYGRWCGSITGASACNSRPTTLLRPAYAGRILLASKSTAGRIVLIESVLRAKAGASGNRRHALLVGIVAAIG
jgi:hypothetical protein